MRKATFVRKYHGRGYESHMVYLVYSYRGHEYAVYENLAQGNEPLSWQHRREQNAIDELIEQKANEEEHTSCRYEDTADYAIDQFLDFLENC